MKKILMLTALITSICLSACGSDANETADNIQTINEATGNSKSVTKATSKAKTASTTAKDIQSSAATGTSSGKAKATKKSADAALKHTTQGSTANKNLKKVSDKAGDAAEILSVFETLGID